MHPTLQNIFDSVSDAGGFAVKLAESGLRSVQSALAGIPLFGALGATIDAPADRDETHYVLVPLPGGVGDFAVFTKRALPPGIGATNDLPKARIFHVASVSGAALLEGELIDQMVAKGLSAADTRSNLADRLDRIANDIDNETAKISGGLVLIGGAVALMNPLLGVGIAAKALLPTVGAKAIKAGTDFVSEKLRLWTKSSAESKVRSEATKEVARLTPEVVANPLLRALDATITNPTADYDPSFDQTTWPDAFSSPSHYRITVEAIHEVYEDILADKGPRNLPARQKKWLQRILRDHRVT